MTPEKEKAQMLDLCLGWVRPMTSIADWPELLKLLKSLDAFMSGCC